MNDEERHDIALFRYGIISPLVSGTYDSNLSKKAFFRNASNEVYKNPNGIYTKVSEGSIERWYYAYMKNGFDGLIPQKRTDKGQSRKLTEDMIEQINYIKKEYPRIPATLIYQRLIQNGSIERGDISLSTINRHINQLNKEMKQTNNKDMKRYERPHINQVWYADSSVGPYMKVDGKKKRIWIIAAIDDASRMVTGIDIFFNDNTVNVMTVLKSAITKFGRPTRLSVDNGSSYKNKQIKLMAARIGMTLIYNPPYTPTSKSKVERFFKTLKIQWMSGLNMDDFNSLDILRESLMTYIQSYNQSVHSSLGGKTPMDRFYSEAEKIKRLTSEQIETSFLFEIERRVSNDNVIVIDEVLYEVHYRYAKQRIRLRYSKDMSQVFIVDSHTGELVPIKLLNKQNNSTIKREKVKLTGGLE